VTEVRPAAPAEVARPAEQTPGSPAQRQAERVVIQAPRGVLRLDLHELWRYRELFVALAWRDVAVRYKQTAIGIAWAILVPFVTMVVFTLVFGKFAEFPSLGVPYPIFTYSALLPWTYFASGVALASTCLVSNRSLVTKVYFPRVLLPLAAVTVPIFDLLFAAVVLVGMMAWFDVWPSFALVLAPAFLLMALLTALGTGLFFAAINVRYRDVPYALPFVIQIWQYVSGVVFAVSALPERWQWVLSLNPMTLVISGFQWGVLGTAAPDPAKALVSVVAMTAMFVVGLWYFRRSEPRFADTI
jgi:homopolymeric O-antigen transport system permease protein